MAFQASNDFKYMLFITPRATKKYERLCNNGNLSLFIDNRSNSTFDVDNAIGITVIGKKEEINPVIKKELLAGYINKHPHLKNFSESDKNAVITVKIARLHIVYNFQNLDVIEF